MEISSGFDQTFHFRNITTAYNKDWVDRVPYFTTVTPIKELAKRLEEIELKVPAMDGYETWNFVHFFLIYWCSALTFLFLLLIIIFMQFQCKKQVIKIGTDMALNSMIRVAKSREHLDAHKN